MFTYRFANHEKSKKHLAEVEKLRAEMELEDDLLKEDEESEQEDSSNDLEVEDNEELVSSDIEPSGKDPHVTSEVGDQSDSENEREVNGTVSGLSTQMGKLNVEEHPAAAAQSSADDTDEMDFTAYVASKKKMTKAKFQVVHESVEDEEGLEAQVPAEQTEEAEGDVSKSSKKKRRRAKKEPTAQAGKPQEESTEINDACSTTITPSSCIVCNQNFSSRSKLFRHIKSTGHAAPLTTVQANAAKLNEVAKPGKKKKGRGKE